MNPGIRSQSHLDELFNFSGTITSGNTAQLLLPQQPGRTSLFIQNTSSGNLLVGLGPATATATVTNNAIASVAVNNGGTGYTLAPQVQFLGGVVKGDLTTAPQHPAAAHATLSGDTVSTITVDDPGSGYLTPPYVFLRNPLPALGGGAYTPSATLGILLTPSWVFSASEMLIVPTSAIAIFGATTSQAFVCLVGGLGIH